ncbi:hypothetical protein [Haloarchaeobius salinus]|uniref:hypothetical protein n=1 Tax=Haloarchaeobius salinus TaxID=1198298 RepID=UPI00210A7F4F|nr:hypothetical protein [Haloarchaeobius salinus]
MTGLAGCLGGDEDTDAVSDAPATDGQPTATATATATSISTARTPDCDSGESLSQSDINGGVTEPVA